MKSNSSFFLVLVACLFGGALGIHRFMVGKIGTGILMILTLGGFGVWSVIDLALIASGNFTDAAGRKILPDT